MPKSIFGPFIGKVIWSIVYLVVFMSTVSIIVKITEVSPDIIGFFIIGVSFMIIKMDQSQKVFRTLALSLLFLLISAFSATWGKSLVTYHDVLMLIANITGLCSILSFFYAFFIHNLKVKPKETE